MDIQRLDETGRRWLCDGVIADCPENMLADIPAEMIAQCRAANDAEPERRARLGLVMAEWQIERLGLPRRFSNIPRLDDLRVVQGNRRAIEAARDYVSNAMQHIEAGRGLMLQGPCGTGKTLLLLTMLQEVMRAHTRAQGRTCQVSTKGDYYGSNAATVFRARLDFRNDPAATLAEIPEELHAFIRGEVEEPPQIVCSTEGPDPGAPEISFRLHLVTGQQILDEAFAKMRDRCGGDSILRKVTSTRHELNLNRDDRAPDPRVISLVLLDDLGAEHVKDWGRDQIAQFVNEFYNSEFPLYVTTNFTQSELEAKIGSRPASRLREMCIIRTMTNPDWRGVPRDTGARTTATTGNAPRATARR